LNTNTAEM